jgi:hypothetical protein
MGASHNVRANLTLLTTNKTPGGQHPLQEEEKRFGVVSTSMSSSVVVR